MRHRKILCLVLVILVFAGLSEAAQDTRAKNIASVFMKHNPKLNANTADKYAGIVIEAAKKYKQDPYVIAGIIIHESTVNNKAVSKGGDYGLMQVRWKVHEQAIKKEYPKVKKAEDMFDARINIFYGTEVFAYCASKTATTEAALMKYSAGSTKLTNKVLATVKELQAMDKKTSPAKTKKKTSILSRIMGRKGN